MSSGLRSIARFTVSAPPFPAAAEPGAFPANITFELSIGNPSTTISGWPSDAVSVVRPRNWMYVDVPG